MSKKIKINKKKFTLFFSVTRSTTRILQKYKLRRSIVAIRPNFELLCRQWLQQPSQKQKSSDAGKIKSRRTTIAGSTIFSVDGVVKEVGSDYLEAPSPSIRPFLRIGAMRGSDFRNPNASVDVVGEKGNGSSVGTVSTGAGDAGDTGDAGDVGQLKQHINSAKSSDPTATTSSEPTASTSSMTSDASGSAWIARPHNYIDPFRRTAGGFALYGRRRSVCVMTTVPEEVETVETDQEQRQ